MQGYKITYGFLTDAVRGSALQILLIARKLFTVIEYLEYDAEFFISSLTIAANIGLYYAL